MDEKEQAHKLSQSIDQMLGGLEPDSLDPETAQLLEIARLRRADSLRAARMAARYQKQVWDILVRKLRDMEG